MNYAPAFHDPAAGIVRRPWQIEAATPYLAALVAKDQLKQYSLPWRLVQITVVETGESVWKDSL